MLEISKLRFRFFAAPVFAGTKKWMTRAKPVEEAMFVLFVLLDLKSIHLCGRLWKVQ
jgi:hypothetical protein